MLKSTLSFVSALVLLVLAGAAVQEHGLKRSPKVGDALKYKLKAELEFIGSGTGTLTGNSTERVLKVEADGSYTVQSETKDMVAEVEGTPLKGKDEAPMQTTFKANGDVVSLRGEKIGSLEYRISNLNAFRAPDKPVKVGDTWVRDIPADAKTGMVTERATFVFEAAEKVGEIDTAKVKYTYVEFVERDATSADGYFWVSLSDGSLVKSELGVKNMPLPNAGIRLNAKITVVKE